MIDALIIFSKALFVLLFALGLVPVLVWLERKVSALIQDRMGPNRARVGFLRLGGLVHLFADAIKLLTKEQIIPKNVNKFYYFLAPIIIASVAFVVMPIVPFADTLVIGDKVIPMQVLNIDAGLLWYFAMTSLMVYGVVLAGWASNNKYALLGGVRSSAQLISYELPLGLSVIGLIMMFGTVHLNDIVVQQGELLFGFLPKWGIFIQPLAAVVFIVCAFAETNRAPFDLAEGESELIAGFHVEYSGMLFGTFFMAEYVAMVVASAMIITLFFGGWQIPYLPTETLISQAAILSPLFMVTGAVVLGALAVLSLLYYRKQQGRYGGDIREKEGLFYFAITALPALGLLALVGLQMVMGFPTWAGPLFAMGAQLGAFMSKTFIFCVIFIWVRWTLPRFRYDQLMFLGWKSLLPLSLANILITGLVIFLSGGLTGGS